MIEQHKGTFRTRQKAKYNAENYDQVKIWVRKGGRDVISYMAAAAGQSTADYIRTLIIRDAERRGLDVRAALGGGGLQAVTDTSA